jgi:uncharacterized protein (DUF4415 family)
MPTSKHSGKRKSAVKAKRVKLSKDVEASLKNIEAAPTAPPGTRSYSWENVSSVLPRLRARAKSEQQVDSDDAPPLTEEFFERADLYHGNTLIRRGRPPSDNPKQALKLRIDADVIEHFRATGPGWQTRINDTLRRAAKLRRIG